MTENSTSRNTELSGNGHAYLKGCYLVLYVTICFKEIEFGRLQNLPKLLQFFYFYTIHKGIFDGDKKNVRIRTNCITQIEQAIEATD